MEKDRIERVDASIAKQLQISMERNARMTNRLRRMVSAWQDDSEAGCVIPAIENILKDEEPVWPPAT